MLVLYPLGGVSETAADTTVLVHEQATQGGAGPHHQKDNKHTSMLPVSRPMPDVQWHGLLILRLVSNECQRAPRPYIRGLAKSTGLTQPACGLMCGVSEALFQMSELDWIWSKTPLGLSRNASASSIISASRLMTYLTTVHAFPRCG